MSFAYSLEQMAQPNDFVGAYDRGQTMRFNNQVRQRTLADYARADEARIAQGAALQGDKQSLASLASLDPNAYVQTAAHRATIDQTEKQRMGGLMYAADTPDKWARMMNGLKAQGHDIDEQDMDFGNRELMLAEIQGLAGVQDQANKDRNYRVDAMNSETSRINAMKKAEGANLKITEVDGNRVVVDMNTGNIHQVLGKAPVRGRAGLSATEFKALRESETDQLNLDETVKGLEQALQLAPQTFEGAGAGIASYVGAKVPGGSYIVDGDRANITQQYQSIMSPESIKTMADTLKGATTDFELRKFESILSDPSQPNNIKQQVINRMLSLARNKQALEGRRVQELRARDGEAAQPSPGADGITQQDQGGGFNLGTVFDDASQIPEGATVVNDDDGQAYRMVNGQLVPVE